MDFTVCTRKTGVATVPLKALVERILMLAEALAEKKFYPYQKQFGYRVIESILLREGDMLTALFSRQSGKTEIVACCLAACMIILPTLANTPVFEKDWRFNITDDAGRYRGYRKGLKAGIYAPIQEQADIAFLRVREIFTSATCKAVMHELNIIPDVQNGNKVYLSNGSRLKSQSASENTKIEGESYHIVVLDEAQDIGLLKVRKSIGPMVAAYNGVLVKIGTCSGFKSDFYSSIKDNERLYNSGGARNHFRYDYTVCQRYNSMYKSHIEKEKRRLGEDSDEFRLSYGCEWLLERGQFITEQQLMRAPLAQVTGKHSKMWTGSTRFSTQVAGIDFGKVHDPTVVTVCDVDWANPIADEYIDTLDTSVHFRAYSKKIVAWMMMLGDNYEEQFARIAAFLAPFKGLQKITLDGTGVGQWGADKFVINYAVFNRGLDISTGSDVYGSVYIDSFQFNARSKADGYKLFHNDLLSGRFAYPASDPVRKDRLFNRFIGEMLDLRKTYQNGLMSCSAPDEPGAHDDFPTSAMLACWGAQTPVDNGTVLSEENNFLVAR